MNESILEELGFRKEVEAVKNGNCPLCGTAINMDDFRDSLSKKEYTISGMCQKCQDKVFGG